MCGIVGNITNKPIKDLLINGLTELEYRGYDSVGIATIGLDNKISIIKNKGHEVSYSRDINNNTKILEADYIIMPTSIIAHETEKKILHLLTQKEKKIFLIGIFSNVMSREYDVHNSYVVRGEPENFFLNLQLL